MTASHSGPSGHAGLFTASGAGNINACLKAKHDGPGSSLFAEKTAGQGSAAEFVSINLSNGNPVVQATALTSAWVFNGEHYGQSDGAAKFHVDENNNHSPCVQITTNGFGAGVDAKNQGGGSAGKFHNSDAMNSDPVVDIDNVGSAAALSAESTGLGGVASFSLDSTGGSSATVVDVTNNGNGTSINAKTTGWGTCGYFEIDNTNSNGFALEAVTKGPGIAVAGRCDGEGSAASFSLNNTNSAIPAVSISNSGLGTGLDVAHIGTTGNAVLATLDPTNIDATLKAVAGGGDAGYFEGDVSVTGDLTVTGTLAKGSGSFKIDHPLDPQNKYLYHSFVESPDMMNVYNGNVRLDENGQAWVQLPDYFEALNRDFRYQLTAIGQSAPGLFIAVEIQDLQFQIAGGTPFQKVSWQVTGIRQDPYARDFPIFPEVDKAPEERGKYLYPQGYDADRSAQISDR